MKAAGLYSQGRMAECVRVLQTSIEQDKDQALAHLMLGQALRSLQRWPEAIDSFLAVKRCTRPRSRSGEEVPREVKEQAGIHHGRALMELDRWEEAIAAFEETWSRHHESSDALFRFLYLQHFACNFTR